MSTNGKFSFLHSWSFTSGDWAAWDLSVLFKTEAKTPLNASSFSSSIFFRWSSWQESIQCFPFTIKKGLKLSAVMEQDWCSEGTHDNMLNSHGTSWTKGPKIVYGACVNLKGLWNSWTFPWHVLEKRNTLRKSIWIYECRLHNLSFYGVSSTEIVHVKWILYVQLHIWHTLGIGWTNVDRVKCLQNLDIIQKPFLGLASCVL